MTWPDSSAYLRKVDLRLITSVSDCTVLVLNCSLSIAESLRDFIEFFLSTIGLVIA